MSELLNCQVETSDHLMYDDYMKKINLRVAAKAVIMNDKNQILILREDSHDESTQAGLYGLPGGRINTDESFFDGLKREVLEETGLKVEAIKPVFVGEWWPTIKGVKTHIVAVFILCRTKSTTVKLSEEHDDFVWLDAADFAKYKFMPPDDEVALSVFKDESTIR